MKRKLGLDAFQFYFSLGEGRSYEAVANHFGVSKTTVANVAKREDWQANVERLNAAVREANEKRAVDAVTAMNERHAKLARLAAGKGAEHLAQGRIERTADALRALKFGIEEERRAVLGAKTTASVRTSEDLNEKAQVLAAKIRAAVAAAGATVPDPQRV
ncbi:MAG: hypothetical protein L6Q99_07265 [Planctomycetes bacterium]|nr:hypothetical protein [Planctomycetota bacterium]